MIDELNRLKLTKRYEQHMAGIRMSKAILQPREDRKPYVHRPLKNKGILPPPQNLEFTPRSDNPFLDITYECYLEQRGRLMRHGELPQDSVPVSKYQCGVFLSEDRDISAAYILAIMHAEEKRNYTPPECRLTVYA